MAKYDGKMKNKIHFVDHLLNNTGNENSPVIEKMFPNIKVEIPIHKMYIRLLFQRYLYKVVFIQCRK